jgi:hypothetical protein
MQKSFPPELSCRSVTIWGFSCATLIDLNVHSNNARNIKPARVALDVLFIKVRLSFLPAVRRKRRMPIPSLNRTEWLGKNGNIAFSVSGSQSSKLTALLGQNEQVCVKIPAAAQGPTATHFDRIPPKTFVTCSAILQLIAWLTLRLPDQVPISNSICTVTRLSSPLPETITGGKPIYRKEFAGDFISKLFRVDENLSHLDHSLAEMPIYQNLAEMQTCCS